MCWRMGKEYVWNLREECQTGLNEILTTCSHYLIRVYSTSESSVFIMFSGATVIVNML